MNIKIQNSPLALQAGDIPFAMQDQGTALVTMILMIEGKEPIQFDAVNKGKKEDVVRLAGGKTYKCNLYIAAYRYGAYGPVYDAELKVNGVTIATANGSVPKKQPSDRDSKNFTLVVA